MSVRDKVYEKLMSLGLEDSKEDFFNYFDNNESVRKQVYQDLKSDGLTDSEEEFYEYMKPSQSQVKPTQGSSEPYTHVYDNNGKLIGGTAYQGAMISPDFSSERASLKEQVAEGGRKFAKMEDQPWAKPLGGVDGHLSTNDLAVRLDKTYNQGGFEPFIRGEEDKKVNSLYTPKKEENADDVWANAYNKFGLTERGAQLQGELAQVQDEITNKYLDEFKNSSEYKQFAGKKYTSQAEVDEANKAINDLFNSKYGEVINNELQPYQQAYNNEVMARYGVDVNEGLYKISKNENSNQVRALREQLDLLQHENARTSEPKNYRSSAFMPASARMVSHQKANEKESEKTSNLHAAQMLIEDAESILNDVSDKNDSGFFGRLLGSLGEKVDDVNNWTVGVAELLKYKSVGGAFEKAARGEELSRDEQLLLEAYTTNLAAHFYNDKDLSTGYKMGQVAGESLPMMVEFILNPLSGAGKVVAKKMLTVALKKGLKGNVAKFGGRLIGDIAAATGMTLTSGMPSVLSETERRLNEDYDYKFDDNGNLNVTKKNEVSAGEAFAKSFATRAIENQSEMIFNAFGKWSPLNPIARTMGDMLPDGAKGFMNLVRNSKAADWYRAIKNNPTLKEVAEKAQFHGLPEEYFEEVYNNLANVGLGEMTMDEALDLDNNIDTFLGLIPTSVVFGMVGLGGMAKERYTSRRNLNRVKAVMSDDQKAKLDELQKMGRLKENRDIREFIKMTIADRSLTPEEKRAEIEYAYELAKQNAMEEVAEAEVQDNVEADNALIDSVTDPSTGKYTEVNRIVVDEHGEQVAQPGYIVGWIGESPIFVPEGVENTTENRIPLKPNEWDPASLNEMENERVKALNEEYVRNQAAERAEMEATYAPEVLNAEMQQGVPFETPNARYVPLSPMQEGNGWVVEEYALDTNNKVAKEPVVRELTNDEFRGMMQAQIEAKEAVQEEQIAAENAPNVVQSETAPGGAVEGVSTQNESESVSGAEEAANVEETYPSQQAPVIPTKEDGSIDFVAYGKDNSFKALGEKYGEKMPHKVGVTAKALASDLKKAEKKLAKAEEALDNAPIGREQKQIEARDKAKAEYEAVKREADFWSEMDADIKSAQAQRESILNPQAEVEASTEPMSADEFIAQQLSNGNVVLNKDDFMRETGFGTEEATALNGGTQKLLTDKGMTLQEAGERLMEIDRENGTNFFDQTDPNAGRDALIELLGSVKNRKELNSYVKSKREFQAEKESEGLRNELEKQVMDAHYASLEDYVLQMEAAEIETPFDGMDVATKDAIFAEAEEEYQRYLNGEQYGQGTTTENAEGSGSVLSEEQSDNSGGTEERQEQGDGVGERSLQESEAAHAQSEEVAKKPQVYNVLEEAERIDAEEQRRRPLRARANEWAKALGVKVTFLESIDEVDATTKAQIETSHAKGDAVPGWVTKSGEVFFFMPDIHDLKEVDDTYIHEVVAHVGLPKLLGKERFGELCDKVWEMMPTAERVKYMAYPGVKNHRDAADEYMAHLAERQNLTPEEKTIWEHIVQFVRDAFDKVLNGIIGKSKLTDEDIAKLIKMSYANLKSGANEGVVGEGTRFSVKYTEEEKAIIDKAKANGTYMKAPNGEPTNLTEKQWAQVRTKAFKKWFGDWEISNLYNRAIESWNNKDSKGKAIFSLSQKAKERFDELLGNDVKQLVITDDSIRHIKKHHGENEELRGQKNMTPEDIVVIPYLVNNFDSMDLEPKYNDKMGNRAISIKKRINGLSVIATIEKGKKKEFLVTSFQFVNSDALDASNETPGLYVRNDSDITKVKKDIEDIKNNAVNSSKIVDENGEPLVMIHNSTTSGITEFRPNIGNAIFFADKIAQNYVSGFERGENDYEVYLNIRNPYTEDYEASYIDEEEGIDGVFVSAEVEEGVGHAAIVKNPNQIKSATDNVGTFDERNPDIRFRVKDNNELVAVHNISEENLRKVLNVGGLIMPSIAITKADMGHEGYGEISLLFDKETINPTDRRNKVYGGDAWTPRFPHLEIKLNNKVMSNLSKTIRDLIEDREVRELYSLSSEIYPDNIERKIANDGVEGYYGKEWMKLAYLLGNGKKVKIPMKMKDYGSMSEIILDMAKEKGLKASDIMNEGYDFYQNNPDFVNSILEIKNRDVINNLPEGKRDAARKFLKREISFSYFDSLISKAVRMEYDLEHGGLKKFIDKPALSASIEKKVKTNNADYNKWVDGLFNGIIEKYGIRNNRDMFTPSGSQRSWEQLHDAATPANILKYMLAENEQGGSGGFFDSNIMGASAESYETFEEIREKGKKRLRKLEEGEYDEWSDSVAKRMSEICNDFLSPSQRNEFGASIDAKIDITNAVAKDKTAKGIYKSMRSDYPGFTMEHAKKVEEIVKEIQEFSIGYFEAKPRRIVPLSEVKKAIVPKNTSKDILEGLKDNGIDVATYKNGDEAARSRLIKKESDGIRFRTVNEPARAYITESEANDIMDVPQSKVRYTKDNIASELYKTTGNHLRELYKGGVLGRVLKGEYAEIDQFKAKADYDKAKTHLGALLKDLVEMKHQATDAAQEVINGVISDVEYAMQYYKDLSLGKDVWRTNVSPRFRISEYGKQVKAEVDRVTSKYKGKEVMFFDSEMTDEEVAAVAPGYTAADLKPYFDKGALGGYSSRLDKISIFADNNPVYDVEDTIFHENLHVFFADNKDIVEAFAGNALSRFPKNVKSLQEKGYSDKEIPEELLVRLTAKAMSYGIFDDVRYNLPESEFEKLKEFLKHFGYDYREEVKSRSLEEGRRGTPTLLGGEEVFEARRVRQDSGRQKEERRARKEELGKLFDQVADMGLDGVLGNKAYTTAMVDIYKALPEDVRAELADNALRNYGGSIAPAVSDYVNHEADASIWDKVVTIVRDALRKIGIDLDLNGNEVKYLLWRSQKPLNRNSVLDLAEDIDKKFKLKVGEYSSTDNQDVISQIRQARADVERNPTDGQKEAGNYKKGHIKLDGFDITLENPKGGVRSGTDKNGKKWSITMNNDYGYIRGTEAVDGDHIDIFLSDNPTEGHVFVVDQKNEYGKFDESKVMYGFNSLEEARDAYLSNYEKGWEKRIMAITEVSKDEFKKWVDSSFRKTKAFSDYKSVSSVDDGTRFRVSDKLAIRDEYEALTKKGRYQAREALQDAMLSLRRVQELIEKASGKKLRDFENAWMHENRLSSVTQAEIHESERKYYKPMMAAVKKLMKAAGLEEEQVADYLMLKHGIERNREMAVRKALTDAEGKIDRAQLDAWYQEKEAIRNDASLPTWREKQEAMDNAALSYGADMSRDYSGLTSMFGTDEVDVAVSKAYDEVVNLENAHQSETDALNKAVKAYTQSTLDKSFASGLMDRKVYNELSNDMYDYYVPLRGFDETTSDEVYSYLDNERGAFNAPLIRAKGRSSKSDNPLAYMKSIAESGIMQGNRNAMKQTFLNMVINNPTDLVSVKEGVWAQMNPTTGEWEAVSAPPIPDHATPADVEAIMETWEQNMEAQAAINPNIKKIREADDVPYRVVGNRMNQHQIVVKRLGKSYTLTVNGNPRLAMALNGQTNPNNTSNDGKVGAYVSKKVDAINRSLSAWYTTRNPDFVASNFMRDTFYTNTIVRAKEGNKYANKFHKHYAELLMPGKMISLFNKYENGTLDPAKPVEKDFLDFMMNGGETGYSNLKDLEHIKRQIAKDIKRGKRREQLDAALEKIDLLNRAVENTARFAAYLTSREEGRTIAKSVFDAKEISVNFNKKGAGGTFFGMTGQTKLGNLAAALGAGGRAMYVFFNAAIQGTTNLLHVMKVNPVGTSAGLAAMFLMGALVPYLFDGDDDEKDYYDLPEHVRRNHLILPGIGDSWVSIPLPIEYRIMYGMGELLQSWRTGHERGSDIARKMLSLSGQALPLNFMEEGLDAFVPSAISPLWQAYNNKSWTGLPIYKDNEFNKQDPEYTKAYSNADKRIVKFTKALYDWTFDEENQDEGVDLNPAIIEHIVNGYFSGATKTLNNLVKTAEMVQGEREFDWRNIPIGNRVFKAGDERTKEKRITNEYFENIEKLEFMQSRERTLKKVINGQSVPEADKKEAEEDFDVMKQSEVFKKYKGFNAMKKKIDKLRKRMKEKGSTPELEKDLSKMQEEANKLVR